MQRWILFLSFLAVVMTLFNIFTYHDQYINQIDRISGFILPDNAITWSKPHVPQSNAMSSSSFSLSVLILTYNNSLILQEILQSFLSLETLPDFSFSLEIVVIDNGCFPSTLQIIPPFYPLYQNHLSNLSLVHLRFCNNTQYATAYNLAMHSISPTTDWILLLNDDVIPRSHFIENFIHHLSIFSLLSLEIGAVGCKLLWPNHRIVEAGSVIRADGGTDNFLRSADSPLIH
jgi:glycosyltransferase involved in cell wall biosynthesis